MFLGRASRVGVDSWFMAGAHVATECVVGDRVRLHAGVVVGADGFGYEFAGGRHVKVPQVGQVVKGFDAEMQALEGEMAQSITRIAVELARQVVRSELQQRPELIARVAHDAVEALQLSARHVRMRVHPDDFPLVQEGAGQELQARETQLIPDADVARGGVKVDADIASVDATIAARWQQAVSAIGQQSIWEDRRTEEE